MERSTVSFYSQKRIQMHTDNHRRGPSGKIWSAISHVTGKEMMRYLPWNYVERSACQMNNLGCVYVNQKLDPSPGRPDVGTILYICVKDFRSHNRLRMGMVWPKQGKRRRLIYSQRRIHPNLFLFGEHRTLLEFYCPLKYVNYRVLPNQVPSLNFRISGSRNNIEIGVRWMHLGAWSSE